MGANCKFPHPLQRDGTSQRQRLVEALRPSYVSVDERELSDLLIYARRYASLLRYYTPTNGPGGNWVDFIEHDISTLVSLISATDYDKAKDDFKAAAYADRFGIVVKQAETFDAWYRESIEGLALRNALRRLIGSVLTDAIRDTVAHSKRARKI